MDIASACLAGVKCRYDGDARPDDRIVKLHKQGLVKLVCPRARPSSTSALSVRDIRRRRRGRAGRARSRAR